MADEQVRATAYWISAFAFFAVMGTLAIYAAAEKKGEHFNAFFTAFGAIGQVVFAYLVWKLGERQFEFTRRVAERQHKIDIFAERARIIGFWRRFDRDLDSNLTAETRREVVEAVTETSLIFSDQAAKQARGVSLKFRHILMLNDVHEEVTENGVEGAVKAWEEDFDQSVMSMFEAIGKLLITLEAEARLV